MRYFRHNLHEEPESDDKSIRFAPGRIHQLFYFNLNHTSTSSLIRIRMGDGRNQEDAS